MTNSPRAVSLLVERQGVLQTFTVRRWILLLRTKRRLLTCRRRARSSRAQAREQRADPPGNDEGLVWHRHYRRPTRMKLLD